MSGGGSNTTTTTTQAPPTTTEMEPWEAAQPYLKTALREAGDIFESGAGFQPYTSSMVTPFSQQTMAGMQSVEDAARQGMENPVNTTGFLSDLLQEGSQGLSPYQQQAGNLWSNMAQGNYMGDPGFNAVLEDAATRANMQASAGGRYGSSIHHGNMARELGKLQFPRIDEARRMMAGLGQQGIQNMFGAAEAFPSAYQAQFAPQSTLMGIGGMYEDLMGRQIQDQARVYEAIQSSPLNRVNWLNAIAGGAGQLGGTRLGSGGETVQRVTQPTASPFTQALGYGLGALGTFGSFL